MLFHFNFMSYRNDKKVAIDMVIKAKILKKVIRILLGSIFVVSAVSKCFGPENFFKEVSKLNFFDSSFDIVPAFGFIVFELILGYLLLFHLNNKVLLAAGITVLILSCYLGYKVLVNDTSDCGCFGNFIYRSNLSALVQDIFILITVVYLYE